jgi:hypothetical protein
MGIDAQSHRVRIGAFLGGCRTPRITRYNNHVILLIKMLSFGLAMWVLVLIILSGDIETNPGPDQLTGIPGLLINTRSVKSINQKRNKLAELQALVSLKNAKVVCLTETWLSSDVRDSEILPLEEFNIYRQDRNSHGGGVLVAVHSSIISKQLDIKCNCNSLDIIFVEIKIPKQPKLALINMYIPPGTHNEEIVFKLRDALGLLKTQGFQNISMMGDFNLPNLDLETGLPLSSNYCSEDFYSIFLDFDLEHAVTCPTHRQGNRLDLILSSPPGVTVCSSVEENAYPSDHSVINFILNYRIQTSYLTRTVFNFKKANWEGLRKAILNANLLEIIQQHRDNISTACQKWTDAVLKLCELFIPRIKLKNIGSPPWIDHEIIGLSKKKETSRRKAIRVNTPEAWARYRRYRNDLRTMVNRKHNAYIRDSYSEISTNPKRFWSMVRSKYKSRTISAQLKFEGKTENSSSGKATLLNKYFYSSFSQPDNSDTLPDITSFDDLDLSSIFLDISEVRLLLASIDPSKATGPDGIPGRILKQCATELAPSLTSLFNLTLETEHVPDLWKRANIAPIFKKGDKELCNNYRPISLLCISSKLLERAIFNKIYDKLSKFITNAQHGFVTKRSTVTQLLTVFHEINHNLDNSSQTDTIYLDFSKAFDSVPHRLLIHKLKTFGITGSLLNWFSDYLLNRTQRVVIENSSSEWLPVPSGVPQGSILGPFLFLLYTNDLGNILSNDTSIALYADDAKIYRRISSLEDCHILQKDLISLEKWSTIWKLNFNVNKCKLLSFTRVLKFVFPYTINNTPLERVTEFNDLGVSVSDDLSWKNHLCSIISRANRQLGLIKRTLGPSAPIKCKLLLYKTLVRPLLSYASQVWFPGKTQLKLLEGIQRRATKFILNNYDSDYKTRLINLNLLPLSYFREICDLCLYYKCRYNLCNLDLSLLIPSNQKTVMTRQARDRNRLAIAQTKTETFAKFYTKRLPNLWNNIPLDAKLLLPRNKDIIPFKSKLQQIYRDKTLSDFNADDPCTWITHCRCPSCRPT